MDKQKLKERLVEILKNLGREELIEEILEVSYNPEKEIVTVYHRSPWSNVKRVESLTRLSRTITSNMVSRGVACKGTNIEPPTNYVDERLRSLGFQRQIYLYNFARDAPLGNNDIYFQAGSYIPLIDMLCFVPKFREEIEALRKNLEVEPEKIVANVIREIGADKWRFYKRNTEFHKHTMSKEELDSENYEEIEKTLRAYEKEKFPNLKKMVAGLRYRKVKGLAEVWQRAIEQHVLYDLVSAVTYFFYRRERTLESPQIKLKLNHERLEPYLEMQVYANTDLTFFKKVSNIKELQKLLPTYKNVGAFDEKKSTLRFWYFLLREHLGLSHELATVWLEEKGFDPEEIPDESHAGQCIHRFLNLFGKTPKK